MGVNLAMLTRTKIVLVSATAVVLMGAAGGAIAKRAAEVGGERHAGRAHVMFEMMDENKDGKVPKAEAEAFRSRNFAEFDKDANGELSLDEYTALVTSFVAKQVAKRFERQDTDKSGGLNQEEAGGRMAKMFEHLDKNDDGAIEKTELRRGNRRHHGGDDHEDGDKDNGTQKN
jgi:Ca2+-binding EF-hand superfamily protein